MSPPSLPRDNAYPYLFPASRVTAAAASRMCSPETDHDPVVSRLARQQKEGVPLRGDRTFFPCRQFAAGKVISAACRNILHTQSARAAALYGEFQQAEQVFHPYVR